MSANKRRKPAKPRKLKAAKPPEPLPVVIEELPPEPHRPAIEEIPGVVEMAPEPPVPVEMELVNVTVPLADPDDYRVRHIDAQLTREQGQVLRRLHMALDKQTARMNNGRVVQSKADALRWLLEKIGESA